MFFEQQRAKAHGMESPVPASEGEKEEVRKRSDTIASRWDMAKFEGSHPESATGTLSLNGFVDQSRHLRQPSL